MCKNNFKWNNAIQDMLESEATEDASMEAYYDQQTADEMQAIAWMLESAEKEGLQCEVVWSFAADVKTSTIQQACRSALCEWDI